MDQTAYRNSTSMGDGNQNCNNVTDSFNTYNNYQPSISDERGQVLEWLSPLDPKKRHWVISLDRVDGVGTWLLQKDGFVSWRTSETPDAKPVLFCCGNPGTGKTYLSSLVIDTLCDPVYGDNTVVACMYCDFNDPEEQPAASVLAALLKQVVAGLEPIPSEIRDAFERAKRQVNGRTLRLPEIHTMLIQSISSFGRVFFCIDALDEFLPKRRPQLLESLHQIVRDCPGARLFVTGRPHIQDEISKYFSKGVVMVPANPRQGDIETYLEKRLELDQHSDAMDEELRTEILRIIPERISEVFLLVSLVMDAILDQTTKGGRRQALYNIREGLSLEGAYSVTLARINGQKGDQAELGMKTLMWISCSHRPLKAEELCYALAVEVGTGDFDLHKDKVPTPRILLACTLGLVAIDQQTSVVRLMHFTLREYLEEHNLLTTAHSMIAKTCLTYLNTPSVRKLTAIRGDTLLAKPFLEYASCHWGFHARMQATKDVQSLAFQLLEQYPHHISATILLREALAGPLVGFSGLHCIAFLGIEEIAAAMVDQKKWDLNRRDSTGATPLMWAARCKNYSVAEFLLSQEDVEPNLSDNDGLTPLLWAARSGEEALVRLLVEQKNVNPDSSDRNGRTPLSFAAQSQHERVVELLLRRGDINPNLSDKYGQTPLSFAAEEGHEAVVELLLERKDIDPNLPDHNGRTPLSFAAGSGNEDVMKLLLQREGVNPSSPNNSGRTPLSFAAWSGNGGSVWLLLELGANPNTPDEYGQTPLLWAARSGQEGVVGLLLQLDVAPDTSNDDGQTPLLWAARSGHEGIVRMLLEQENVNPDSSESNGRTPLSFAARYGHEGVVKLLLEHGGVNPDSTDNHGRTPLSQAAMRGHEGVVKLLLERGGVNPNSSDKDGQTSVSFAAIRGYEGVARLLTQSKQLNHRLSQESVQIR